MGVIGGWGSKQLRGDELIKKKKKDDNRQNTYCSRAISTVQTELLLVIVHSHSASVIPIYCSASVTTGMHIHNSPTLSHDFFIFGSNYFHGLYSNTSVKWLSLVLSEQNINSVLYCKWHFHFKWITTFNCFSRPDSHRVLLLEFCRNGTKSTIVTSLLSGLLPLDNCYILVSSFVPLQWKPCLRRVLDQFKEPIYIWSELPL